MLLYMQKCHRLITKRHTVTPERTNYNIETIYVLRLAYENVSQMKGVQNLQLPNKLVSLTLITKARYEGKLRKQ